MTASTQINDIAMKDSIVNTIVSSRPEDDEADVWHFRQVIRYTGTDDSD